MDELLQIFIFIGSFSLLFFCYLRLRKSLMTRDWMLFFWAGLIYFICIPFFVDGTLMLFGKFEKFHSSYINENPLYWGGVNLKILSQAVIFSIAFIGTYWLFDKISKYYLKSNFKILKFYNFSNISILIIFLISLVPCLSILNDGADFIENQKNNVEVSLLTKYTAIFLPISAIMIYYCAIRKKYLWMVLFTIPLLSVAIVGQSRTLFFYIPTAYLLAYFHTSKKNISIRNLVVILITLLTLSQMVKIIANENYGFSDSDNKVYFIIAKSFRDVSIGDFYYSIDIKNNFPELTTQGKSSIALFATGIVPPILGGHLFDPKNSVTYRIYQLRFGEVEFGSMHPTLIGYSFFDLGWLGLIIAILLPIVLRLYEYIISKFNYAAFISPVMISSFMFVALRGSLNVAYFNLIYGGLTIFIILTLVYMIDISFLSRTGNKR